MNPVYDIAIVGSGFGGSLLAMIAKRLGRSVILLERGVHPRVVIGESSTPLSNLLLEDLADRYDLPALKPLAKWGSWQKNYPDLACGLKRGFSFFHHDGSDSRQRPSFADQLLVAASPHNAIADTHWYRADVDHFLLKQAISLGVDYIDRLSLDRFTDIGDEVLLCGSRDGEQRNIRARFVVDAAGPGGFLHRILRLSDAGLPGYPGTQALYSHFSGVRRLDTLPGYGFEETPPYPIDAAAVHHVFDGGWVWVLRFNNGITSAGVAATDACAERLGLSQKERGWQRLLAEIPSLGEQFAGAKAAQPFTYTSRLAFRSSQITGRRWAMLPSAAGFVDPLLSTGIPLTLLGVSRLAEVIERRWTADDLSPELCSYSASTEAELLATSRLIASLYTTMGNFPAFRALSLLYFAAASFSETVRRLGHPQAAPSFLLHDHPGFGAECRGLVDRIQSAVPPCDASAIAEEVHRIIQPIDVAGLGKTPPNHWYPVRSEDLREAAWKVDASQEQITVLLERAGFNLAQT